MAVRTSPLSRPERWLILSPWQRHRLISPETVDQFILQRFLTRQNSTVGDGIAKEFSGQVALLC